jgi:hypothetical protein
MRPINSSGQVVGTGIGGNYHGWIWDSTHGTRDLNELLDPLTGSGWIITHALSISDNGKILAYGTDGFSYYYLRLIPGPSSACTPDLSTQFAVTRGGFRYDHSLNSFVQSVTLTNNTGAPVTGVYLVLDNLTNATLSNSSGTTSCNHTPAVSPFVIATVGTVPPGGQVTVGLQFQDPSMHAISYATRVLGGTGTP